METTTIAIDTTQAEQNLVNLTAKVELLTARLKELTAVFKEAETALATLDAQEIAGAELQTSGPQIVYSVNMGDIMQLANAPASVFTEEFLARLQDELPRIVKAVPKKQEQKAP